METSIRVDPISIYGLGYHLLVQEGNREKRKRLALHLMVSDRTSSSVGETTDPDLIAPVLNEAI